MTVSTTQATRPYGLVGLVRRHPHVTFLLLFNTVGQAVAFVPVVARRVYGVDLDGELFLLVPTLLFLLAPALLITRIAWGREGLRRLLADMLRFRVRAAWYLLPLVVVPVLTVVTALPAPPGLTAPQAAASYVFGYLPALLLQLVSTNWWEETVWTGFFQGPLQNRFGPWRAVLLTTPFFALEHVSLVAGGTLSEGLVQLGLIVLVSLPARALCAWVYNSSGSLALVGLVHAAANAAGLNLVPDLFHQPGAGGSALLVLGVVLVSVSRGRLGRPRSVA